METPRSYVVFGNGIEEDILGLIAKDSKLIWKQI